MRKLLILSFWILIYYNITSAEWKIQKSNVWSRAIYCIDKNRGWAVGNDIVKWEDITSSVETDYNDDIRTSNEYRLLQNSPHPFNPTTMIRYLLPRSGFMTLRIYILVGQEIEILINGYKNAGVHEITWTAKGLPRGIYFYRLQASDPSADSILSLSKDSGQ